MINNHPVPTNPSPSLLKPDWLWCSATALQGSITAPLMSGIMFKNLQHQDWFTNLLHPYTDLPNYVQSLMENFLKQRIARRHKRSEDGWKLGLPRPATTFLNPCGTVARCLLCISDLKCPRTRNRLLLNHQPSTGCAYSHQSRAGCHCRY